MTYVRMLDKSFLLVLRLIFPVLAVLFASSIFGRDYCEAQGLLSQPYAGQAPQTSFICKLESESNRVDEHTLPSSLVCLGPRSAVLILL